MPTDSEVDAHIKATARVLGLPLAAEWLPAVRENLAVTLKHAATVGEFSLSDEADPAPVFRA
jgi:hypothetical protein